MDWTETELATLRELYPSSTKRQIAAILNRSEPSVRRMVLQLGLKKRPTPKRWTQAELELVRALFPTLGAAETAQAVGRPLVAVLGMGYRLGLKQAGTARHLPIGTERLIRGCLYRKVTNSHRYMQNWRPVSTLEESPEIRELYRLLAQIQREARNRRKESQ